MTILDSLMPARGRALIRRATPEQAPRIAGQIEAIEKELAARRAELPAASLDAINGVAGAAERLDTLTGEVSGLERRLATLGAAMDAANKLDHESLEQERARKRAVQVGEVRRHLAARDEAAEALTKAITAAVASYKTVLAASRAAVASVPAGAMAEGGLFDVEALYGLTEREIFRVGGAPGRSGFPCRHQAYLGNLNDLASLPDVLRAATENIVRQLERPAPQPERARTRRYFSEGRA